MRRAVWTGSLAFGLVAIPVRLFPATEPKDVRFHLTDARGRRVRYRRVVEAEPSWEPRAEAGPLPEAEPAWEPRSGRRAGREAVAGSPQTGRAEDAEDEPVEEEEVAFEDLKRAYATDDGRFVVLDREEIESLRPERSATIEVEDFVDLADIDPVYFEKSYHLVPQRGSERPYALLLRALQRAGRVGIGRFVLRTKPHLVAIRPADGVLGLETLFFGDEIRDGRELAPGVDAVDVSPRELALAESLIETLHTSWNPAAYSDTYRQELLRRIAQKAPIEAPEEAAAPGAGSRSRAEELMEALKASVEAAKRKRSEAPRTTKKRASRKRTA